MEQARNATLFVSLDGHECQSSAYYNSEQKPNNRNAWLVEQKTIGGTDVIGFLLFSGIGPDPSLIVKYLSTHLLPSIFESKSLWNLSEQIAALTGRGTNWTRRIELHRQLEQLIKRSFDRTDEQASDWIQEQILLKEEEEEQELIQNEEQRRHEWHSGCFAMLALVIGTHLIVADCGEEQMVIMCKDNCAGQQMAICFGENQAQAATDAASIQRCFGRFDEKTRPNSKFTAEPRIHPLIELDHFARFLLFVPRPVLLLFKLANQRNRRPLVNVITDAVIDAVIHADSKAGNRQPNAALERRFDELLWQLVACAQHSIGSGAISIAYVDLRSNIFPKNDFLVGDGEMDEIGGAEEREDDGNATPVPSGENTSNGILGRKQDGGPVESFVDWSELQTHHLREVVLAKVESIRQKYARSTDKKPQKMGGATRGLPLIHEDR